MRIRIVLLLSFLVVLSSVATRGWATTYYISTAGNDAASGTSPATAWQTIGQVNAARFQPGDQIRFRAGESFAGSLWLQSAGTEAAPIIISSYGPGMATISSGTDFGFYAADAGGIELRRLKFQGAGRLSNTNSGVLFTTQATQQLRHLVLDSLDVSGYLKSGIILGSNSADSGYDGVRITNCRAYANGEAGISSYSYYPQISHHNWYVARCRAYDNSGRADVTTTHTGNGIVVAGVDGIVVEQCEAYNNGWLNSNPGGGPVGIWGWLCNNLVIQECESHHNRSGLAHDGGGFDLDGGCTNSVLQYNYSHDNDGAGYLLAQFNGAPPMHDLIIRYNISENDARRYGQGAIMLWSSGDNGGIQRASIHNNSVYLSPATDNTQAKAFYLSSGGVSGITVRNNIFQTTEGLPQVKVLSTAGLQLQGNGYWGGTSAPLTIEWGGTLYSSLSAWRAATGQETLSSRPIGLNQAPLFVNAGGGGTLSSVTNRRMQAGWNAYVLQTSSGLIGQAVDMAGEFDFSPGPRDFYGTLTPSQGSRGNLGAVESASSPLPVRLVSFTATQQPKGVQLRWTTAAELRNAYFEVQISLDGRTFTRLETVAGRGATAQTTSYAWLDERTAPGQMRYYRLLQVDTDGVQAFSGVVTVAAAEGPAGPALQAWPNPCQDNAILQIQCPQTGMAVITCTDAHGRTVLNRTLSVAQGTTVVSLPEVGQLPWGVYALVVQQGTYRAVVKLARQ